MRKLIAGEAKENPFAKLIARLSVNKESKLSNEEFLILLALSSNRESSGALHQGKPKIWINQGTLVGL